MRRLGAIFAAVAILAGIAGCGSGDAPTPGACLVPASAYLSALGKAPRAVRLDGDTAISACLTKDQPPGELSRVGSPLVKAATILNASARQRGDAQDAVALGYLVGAAERGAADTGGIHAELVRRLRSAALFSPRGALPAAFRRAYDRGYAAGKDNG